MRRLSVLLVAALAVLAACEAPPPPPPPAEPPAPAPVAGCAAGPEWELPAGQELRVRFVRVSRLPESSANGLAFLACIDTIHPELSGSINMAVFRRDGRLAWATGQATTPLPSGKTFTFPMSTETLKQIAGMGPFAHDVVLQIPLRTTAGVAFTTTVRTRAGFTGVIAAHPLPRSGTCLAPPPASAAAEARDVSITLDQQGTVRMVGCVVARRMAHAELIGRVLVGTPGVGQPVTQGAGPGNGIGNLHPVLGHPGRTIALIGADSPFAGPAYPLVPVDMKTRACQEPAGPACTPGADKTVVLPHWLSPL